MFRILPVAIAVCGFCAANSVAQDAPDFQQDVRPLLNKYCVGCHNDQDREGELSLETADGFSRRTESGRVVEPGRPEQSRLLQVINGAEPKMPPEDSPQPTKADIELLTRWIKAGAGMKAGMRRLVTPQIAPQRALRKPVTAMDWSRNGRFIATGRYGEVTLFDANKVLQWRVTGLPGKINSLRFSKDGKQLAVASGVTGFDGQAIILSVDQGIQVSRFVGHRDTLYAAVFHPNKAILATAGYDRKIILWDTKSGQQLRTLSGHNDAIYDLDFSNDGSVLISASGDETVKVWQTQTGQRLDTRSEPLAEQFTVRFAPDGQHFLAAGADNRIRVWRLKTKDSTGINPLVYSRFAHEGAVTHLGFSDNGRRLLSVAEDQTVKLWDTRAYSPLHVFAKQPDSVLSLAVAPRGEFLLGRIDGSLRQFEIPKSSESTASSVKSLATVPSSLPDTKIKDGTEAEPNDTVKNATAMIAPATFKGTIHAPGKSADHDLYRFASKAGQRWVVDLRAARDKSPLDSKIEILDDAGQPVPRVLLRAVRDSYFTFRGKDSNTSDDFRVHNWEEMELNEYLYSNGEVNKLFMYPRGPDSGFKVYPGRGSRHAFFGTTPNSHALHEPCYVVEPHSPGTQLLPNGLPTFTLNYENDDDGRRKNGRDSFLIFTAPADGDYFVRVSDTRSFQGEKYSYALTVRPPKPDFTVKLNGANPKVGRGSGREFNVTVDRIDGFDGEVRIDISNLPPGLTATTPLIIEPGHNLAIGSIFAAANAPDLTPEIAKATKVVASAVINGRDVQKDVNNLGEIKLADPPKVTVELLTANGQPAPTVGPLEFTIAPGETIAARVRITRNNNFKGRVSLGKEDGGRNLSHGLYVANIGLNGLLIVENETEREFFISAARWVEESSRLFHLKADTDGGQTTLPALIHVRRKTENRGPVRSVGAQ